MRLCCALISIRWSMISEVRHSHCWADGGWVGGVSDGGVVEAGGVMGFRSRKDLDGLNPFFSLGFLLRGTSFRLNPLKRPIPRLVTPSPSAPSSRKGSSPLGRLSAIVPSEEGKYLSPDSSARTSFDIIAPRNIPNTNRKTAGSFIIAFSCFGLP